MRLRGLPRAALAVVRGGGPGALAVAILRRALRPIATFHTLVFFETVLGEPRRPAATDVPIEMHVVAGDEVARFRAPLEAAGLPWDEVSAQAAKGDRCTVALSDGKVIHARWMSTGPAWVSELHAWLVPQPGEAYIYGAFTPPDVRGHGVQPAVSARMVQWSRGQGFVRHVFYVRSDNAPGLRIVSKVGARRTAAVRCWWVRGLGAWITGVDEWARPRLAFGPAAVVRAAGQGLWVRA